MILDFTNLSAKETKRLNEIAGEIKAAYTEFVDEYCRKYGSYLFWATPFASRNTYNDDTYLHVSRLLLAREIATENPDIEGIVAETRGEYLALRNLEDLTVPVSYRKTGFFGKLRKKLDRWRGLASYIRRHIAYIMYADKSEFKYPEEVSIVIGPAISTDFDGYYFNDRYTTGIFDYHDGLYLPYFVNTRHLPNKVIFDRLRNCSNYKFLYDRSLIRMSDIWEIIDYWLYVNKIKKDTFKYKGIDVSAIVRQSLEIGKGNSTSYDGLIMRKMLARLAQKGIKVQNFIQWYEGRPFDVLTASAIRKFFPEANSVGYEGFPLIESILGEYMSQYQYDSQNAPKKMAVISELYREDAVQFCKDVELLFVPSLRNEFDTDIISRKRNDGRRNILFLMSGVIEYNRYLIGMIYDHIAELTGDYHIRIKNHPTCRGCTLKDYGFDDDITVEYVDGKIGDCLGDVDVVVTSVTTATLEVATAGIPLIVLFPKQQIGFTAIPSSVREKSCQVIYDSSEFSEVLVNCFKNEYTDKKELMDMMLQRTTKSVQRLFK